MAVVKLGKVQKVSAEAQAATILRDSIVSGKIAAGTRITEIQLSAQMNLARATVRTALHQLAGEGLLKLTPYTGWAVISFDAQDVWELYTLRSAIERLASRLVAEKMDHARSTTLKQAFDALVAACRKGNRSAIAEADFSLHKTIVALAEHQRLAAQYHLIEQQIRMYIYSSDALIATPKEIIAQHQPMLDAILAGKGDEAARLSEQHNLSEGEKLFAHVQAKEP